MLHKQFQEKIRPELQEKLGVDNPLAVPELEKVVINMRVPEGKENKGALKDPMTELGQITGQKPKVSRSRQSISGFQLAQGDPIGLKVTLRDRRMYDFLERLFNLVLPRVRDFRGLSLNKFDDHGNYNLTIKDEGAFPEINLDKLEKNRSLQITIVTSSDDLEKSKELLIGLGAPFTKEDE